MKLYALITLFLTLIMLFLPFLSLNKSLSEISFSKSENSGPETTGVLVSSTENGSTDEVDLKSYLVGVVASEMPASFETEALKAQAVAAYSYQKYLKENGSDYITDSSEIHQGYKTDEELKSLWGNKYDSYKSKIMSAVESVFGEYLIFDGKTVPALYHALSPGVTESAENVFGNKAPCLMSTTAPGDKLSPDYCTETKLSKADVENLLKSEDVTLSENASDWIEVTKSLKSGYVKEVRIGDKLFNGNKVRKLFSLNSPFFSAEHRDESFIFTVYGKGHGVGMSQYSADYMARQGFSYEYILLHFYKGAEIVK